MTLILIFFPCEEFYTIYNFSLFSVFLPLLYYLFPLLPSFTPFFDHFSLFFPVYLFLFYSSNYYFLLFPLYCLFSHISPLFPHLCFFIFLLPSFPLLYPLSLYFTGWFFSLSKFWVEYIPPVYDLLLDMNCLMLPAGIPRGGVSGYPPF